MEKLFRSWLELQTVIGHLNNGLLVRYSGHGLNNGPFDDRTNLDHLNTELVRYSDPRCRRIREYNM